MSKICNPVLRGFNPDPSCCRKGEDYYIATSTFEYFPIVPIYHSRNLSEWEYIGSCINHQNEIVNLLGCKSGKGVYAPCIRYNSYDDTFYVITTLVRNDNYYENVCFYVKSKNPSGPWSEPIEVKGAEGIDPSLFFDDDGKAYIIGNMRPEPGNQLNKNRYIWIDSIDLETGQLGGEKTIILKDGAVYNAVCPEGPRLMKKDGWYYVLIAEGGTEHNHAESVFRSRNPFGPYDINPRNPILTHRMLGRNSEFNSIGHADIFNTLDGRWFASTLGVRPYEEPFLRNIGRETFIVPVIWEDDWPVFAPETGKVEHFYESGINDKSVMNKIDYPIFLRSDKNVKYSDEENYVVLNVPQGNISDTNIPAFIGWRQTEKNFYLSAVTDFNPENGEEAGLVIMLNSQCFYKLTIRRGDNGKIISTEDEIGIIWSDKINSSLIKCKAECHGLSYIFCFSEDGENWIQAGMELDGRKLSKLEFGFTGVVFGLYAHSFNSENEKKVIFKKINYLSE